MTIKTILFYPARDTACKQEIYNATSSYASEMYFLVATEAVCQCTALFSPVIYDWSRTAATDMLALSRTTVLNFFLMLSGAHLHMNKIHKKK